MHTRGSMAYGTDYCAGLPELQSQGSRVRSSAYYRWPGSTGTMKGRHPHRRNDLRVFRIIREIDDRPVTCGESEMLTDNRPTITLSRRIGNLPPG